MLRNKRTLQSCRVRALESLEPRQLMHGGTLASDVVVRPIDSPIVALAHNGEDDHLHFDLGDAPNIYGTRRASNGPFHRIDPGVRLGSRIDAENDGQPTLSADGDDTDAFSNDEDGVRLLNAIVPGAAVQVEITASTGGFVNAWMDWQRDGSFDAIDQIFTTQPVVAGANVLTFNVPPQANATDTYARYRFSSSDANLGPLGGTAQGELPNGEVEDYAVKILDGVSSPIDFGDAPDSYGTLLASNGARHRIDPAVFLGWGGGTNIDGELNGQPSKDAKADDKTPNVLFDDEDGVRFDSNLIPGQLATVQVAASVDGFLNAWVDFDQSSDFSLPEKVFDGRPIVAGINTLQFMVPANAQLTVDDPTFARFRFSRSNQFLAPTTTAEANLVQLPNGEVEDYTVEIVSPPPPGEVVSGQFDFGTLPHPYPNEYLSIQQTFSIGAAVDAEPGRREMGPVVGSYVGFGTFSTSVKHAEYDGVTFNSEELEWNVQVRGEGTLTAKVDWNRDGSFDPEETHSSSCKASPGGSDTQECIVSKAEGIATRPDLEPGTPINVRFVFEGAEKSLEGIPFGEITDVPWFIPNAPDNPSNLDFGDAPSVYPTRLVDDGARHTVTQDGPRLGRRIDAEPDGLPSSGAWRDDATGRDDEDGVLFTSAIVPGGMASVGVAISRADGMLDAWIDFDQDGIWEATEQIFASEPVARGRNSLDFDVPNSPWNPHRALYARFRLSTDGGLSPAGPADDGEVEDYAILQNDFNGDGKVDIGDADTLQDLIQGNDVGLQANIGGDVADVAIGATLPQDSNRDNRLDEADLEHFRESVLESPRGDIDGDGETSFRDFLKFSANFGRRNANYSDGDLDGDGEVKFADFLGFSSSFGESRERTWAFETGLGIFSGPDNALLGTSYGGD